MADDYITTVYDPSFARSLTGYTSAEYTEELKVEHDPHGFVGKRVLLIDLPQESLNGCSGLVTGVHALANTYSILLDSVQKLVYVPAENLIILVQVESGISKHGGEYDRDDAREKSWLIKGHENHQKVSAIPCLERAGQAGRRVRINKCHNFAWSRALWHNASLRIGAVVLLLLGVYLGLGLYFFGQKDGLKALDLWYMLAASITTVGLGDIHPSSETARAAAVALLPLGIIVLAMFVSFVFSHALSVAPPLASDALDLIQPGPISKWFGTVQGRLFYAFIKISLVLVFGAVVFYADEDKYFFGEGFPKNDQYEGRTFIDALFFASVIASTVGYGHLLAPKTDGAKAFLIFYFFFSTYVVGALLGEVLDLYVNGYIGENIVKKLIGSTTWVHKADMFGDGHISESAFILFKLIQMQAVDVGTLDRLIDAYHDLEKTGDGYLTIGIEVPSADQVREMQRIKDETKNPKTLPEIWKDIRSTHLPPDPNSHVNYHVQYFRFNECYDFAWSRQLWANATVEISKVAFVTLVAYVGLSFYTLTWLEGFRGIDSWYFLIATVTTVGFGDFAPTKQVTRGFAIFLIPIGLIVYSLVISFFSAYSKSQTPPSLNKKKDRRVLAAVFLQSAWRGRKVRNLQGLKTSAKATYVTHAIATAAPKSIKRVVSASPPASLSSQYAKVLLKLTSVIAAGALFVKFYRVEADRLGLSWIEALYVSVQTVTSVGYGDITLTSDGGKIFMIFFMFIGTVIHAGCVGRFIDLLVNGYFGTRINDTLISSTIWVHKADIDGDGKVTQPDFILFKLQQMQQVDSQILDRLIDRYNELDTDGSGFLTLGNEIPSEFQVESMRHIKEELKLKATLVEMWLRIVKDGAQSNSRDVWFQNFMSWPRIKLKSRDKMKFQIDSKKNAKQSKIDTQFENAERKRIALEDKAVLRAQKENERLQKAKDKKATKEQLALEKLKLRKEKERLAEEKRNTCQDAGGLPPPKKKAPLIPRIRRTKISSNEAVSKNEPVRLIKCQDIKWSRSLWARAAMNVGKIGIVLTGIYFAFGFYFLSFVDGRSAIDSWYLLSASLTTVGLGVLSPSQQNSRLAAIFILPIGLILIGFFIVFSTAYARADFFPVPSEGLNESRGLDVGNFLNSFVKMHRRFALRLNQSTARRYLKVFLTFTGVIFLGTVVFYADDGQYFGDETKFMAEEEFNARTFVDALYFATVIAISVGYGHTLKPITDSAKGFLIFYFFFSTIILGWLVAELVDIYVNGLIGESVVSELIHSNIYVHLSDNDGDGRVTEADFILFKLQQMLKVDAASIDRLHDRFCELDSTGRGALLVGIDVPSAAQVKELQRIKIETETNKSAVQMWQEIQRSLKSDGGELHSSLSVISRKIRLHQQRAPANRYHKKRDQVRSKIQKNPVFWSSHQRWANAAVEVAMNFCVCFVLFTGLTFYLLAHREGMQTGDGVYFLISTLTTVGFGDFAPTKQETRASAVVLLPVGLLIMSLILVFCHARAVAHVSKAVLDKYRIQEEWASTILQSAYRGVRTRNLNVNPRPVNTVVAHAKPSDLQFSGVSGELYRNYVQPITFAGKALYKRLNVLLNTLTGQFCFLFFELVVIFVIGAMFFRLHPRDNTSNLSWVDAFYLAVQTSTTIGYGDITMTSSGGKIFMGFYMVFSTFAAFKILRDFIDLSVNGCLGAHVNDAILENTQSVHKADIRGEGKISESDYILFMLQQMQKVENRILDRLIDQFRELDIDRSGFLNVGVEVPSAAQVAEMEIIRIEMGSSRTLKDMWISLHAKIADKNNFLDAQLKPLLDDLLRRISILIDDPLANVAYGNKNEIKARPRRKCLPTSTTLAILRGENIAPPDAKSSARLSDNEYGGVLLKEESSPSSLRPKQFSVGDRVQVCDELGDGGSWEPGEVTFIDSDGIYVTKDGWDDCYVWAQIRQPIDQPPTLQSAAYYVRDRVEACDDLSGDLWEPGTVTAVSDDNIYVLKDGWDESFVWENVRPMQHDRSDRDGSTAQPSRAPSLSAPPTASGRFEADLGVALMSIQR